MNRFHWFIKNAVGINVMEHMTTLPDLSQSNLILNWTTVTVTLNCSELNFYSVVSLCVERNWNLTLQRRVFIYSYQVAGSWRGAPARQGCSATTQPPDPFLRPINPNRMIYLSTDTSQYAFGWCTMQKDDNGDFSRWLQRLRLIMQLMTWWDFHYIQGLTV